MANFLYIKEQQRLEFNKLYERYLTEHSDGTFIQYPASHGPDVNNEQIMRIEFGENHYKEFCKALRENDIYFREKE
ncbi:hypothetical protein [Acidithiobacillus ferrivorans]|uniref:Uncharacterized protein n=1 Tax=Acidithiobacillus ferrivorans TaxID=160808 RepID=A0A7T4WEK7_9PROT|nr:hypothetical protein [Acidithiobacillus ferrivorans]QQD73167.1 hypothetical protein H2515_02225 [Acidithiobacillus ferrivorans]